MAVLINGNLISFSEDGDIAVLNCPIKKIALANSPSATLNIVIDGKLYTVGVNSGRVLEFPSLNGYPGNSIQADKACSLFIEEFGDKLNPNYFSEDIANWKQANQPPNYAGSLPKED